MKKYVIDKINNEILNVYNIKIKGFERMENPSILAFYNLGSEEIYINNTNKQVFNDFYIFLEVMLHENVHKINHKNGVEDVYMDGNKQIHNEGFKNAMIDEYGLYCNNNYNGEIDILDERNRPFLIQTMKDKINFQDLFNDLQRIYFESIYEEIKQESKKQTEVEEDIEEEHKEKEELEEYIFEEIGGIEI